MIAVRTHYLDASAIVKLFVQEEGSDKLREYFSKHSVFHATSLCFAEALGVLKAKNLRKLISQEAYLSAAEELCISAFGCTIEIDEISITTPQVFNESEKMARKYDLDLIDCFQIYTLRHGVLSVLAAESKPILITADTDLANAVKSEGLRAWDLLNEDPP